MFDIDYRVFLYVILGLGCFGTFAFSRDRIRNAFLFFICTLGLGWRTLHVTEELKIHPAEVVLWTLFLCWLGRPRPRESKTPDYGLPAWLWLLIPFWILAWLPAAENSYSWDVKLAEFRTFLLFVPQFIVTTAVLAKKENWRPVLLMVYGVGIWIAAMGILEYVFPEIADLLPGFVSNPSALISADRFARASFSFYGNPIAVCVCILALPIAILIWRWWPAGWSRTVTLGGAVLQVGAIYIAGNRAIWLLTALLAILFALLKKRYTLGVALILIGLVGSQALPDVAQARLHSLYKILEGDPIDSSGIKRWERVIAAFYETLEWPLGRGWAAAGWVHCDFVQIAANLGIIPGLIFAAAYAATLWRLWSRTRSPALTEESTDMGLALLLSFVAVGMILAFEPVVVLPQTALPVWLVWVLVETWLRQTSLSLTGTDKAKKRVWSTPDYPRLRLACGDMRVLGKA